MAESSNKTPEERARKRASELGSVQWHVAVYVIVNAFLWALDLIQGDGVNWAYWVTIPWGVGLAFHVAAFYIEDSGIADRRYEKALARERERDQQSADH